jgi:tetratricopeptide (TPR) repeat protein
VEARANYEEALGILRRLHGEKHPKVAYALKGIADILRRHDESDEALEVYKKVLNIQRRVYGKDHPQVAQTFRKIQDWNHGTLIDLGKSEEATVSSIKAASIRESPSE